MHHWEITDQKHVPLGIQIAFSQNSERALHFKRERIAIIGRFLITAQLFPDRLLIKISRFGHRHLDSKSLVTNS
jgi:hypothetical protein